MCVCVIENESLIFVFFSICSEFSRASQQLELSTVKSLSVLHHTAFVLFIYFSFAMSSLSPLWYLRKSGSAYTGAVYRGAYVALLRYEESQ